MKYWPLTALLVATLSGCFNSRDSLPCHKVNEYQQSRSVIPITIPAGLDAPDSTGMLVIPPGPVNLNATPEGQDCLEWPPNYFDKAVGATQQGAAAPSVTAPPSGAILPTVPSPQAPDTAGPAAPSN